MGVRSMFILKKEGVGMESEVGVGSMFALEGGLEVRNGGQVHRYTEKGGGSGPQVTSLFGVL